MGTATESENRVSRSDTQQKGSGGGSQGRSLATSAGQKGQGKSGNGDGLSNALGWFSIGLGLAQVTAPRGVARFIGVDDSDRNCNLMRAVGARELASGVGLLSQPRQPGWAWTRVAGDVMDLALLSSALTSDDNQRGRTSGATAAVLGVAVLDVLCGAQLSRSNGTTDSQSSNGQTAKRNSNGRGIRVQRSITINRLPEDVYAFWRDFQNLPRFMRHLESVQMTEDGRSHWKAEAPAGMSVEWDAEMTEDRPNELIAWRSLEGAEVENSGRVQFARAPGGRGTEVAVDLHYSPSGGVITAKLAKLFHRAPGQEVNDDLRSFKQVMETGEIVVSDATVNRGPHPAQPPKEVA